MKFALLLPLLVSSLMAMARPPVMPDEEQDFGMSFSQPAAVFALERSDIVWMDGDYFREDPRLAGISDDEFVQFFLSQPLSHLSRLQFAYDNLLMEIDPGVEPVRTMRVVHPPDYMRADWMPIFSDQSFVTALDGKGGGISVEAEGMVRHWIEPMMVALGRLDLPPNAGEHPRVIKMLKRLEEALAAYRQLAADASSAIEQSTDELEKASFKHSLLERVNKPHEFTKLLYTRLKRLINGQPISESDRNELLRRFRSLDYTNGLMPLERGYKEVMMGIALSSVLEKYNSKHGTGFGVVRPVMLVKLPVKILGPDGTKKPACILYRESHWRAGIKATFDFRERVPKDVVGPVLQGGMQFDIFGRLVDLELPEIKLAPLSRLTKHQQSIGQPIEQRCTYAMNRFVAGDPSAARALEEEVRRLAAEVEIPEAPSHRSPKAVESEANFLWLMQTLGDPTGSDPLIVTARVEQLLHDPRVTDDRKEAVLHLLLKRSRELGINTIKKVLEKAHEEKRANPRKVTKLPYLRGAIRSLILKQDITNLMGDRATSSFFRDLRHQYPNVFWEIFRGTANELMRDLLSMVSLPIDDFYPGNDEYQSMSAVLEAIVRAAIAGEGKEGVAATDAWNEIQLQRADETVHLPEVVYAFPSELHYMAVIFTAQIYFGDLFSDAFLSYLDPDDLKGQVKAQAQLRSVLARVREQVEYLRQLQQLADSCGGKIAMIGGVPVVAGGNIAGLVKLMGGE